MHRQSGRHLQSQRRRRQHAGRMPIPKRNIDQRLRRPRRCWTSETRSVPLQFELPVDESEKSSVQLCVDFSLMFRLAVADSSASLFRIVLHQILHLLPLLHIDITFTVVSNPPTHAFLSALCPLFLLPVIISFRLPPVPRPTSTYRNKTKKNTKNEFEKKKNNKSPTLFYS